MAQNSAIQWTEATWNPLAGCTRASEGCDNCYAAKMSLRLEAMGGRDIADGRDPGGKAKYIGIATKNGKGVAVFNGKINLDMDAIHEPILWKKPRMVFVNSMSDLFHKDVPFSFVAQVFETMRLAHWHTFQVLTKRPERMYEFWQWVQVSRIGLAEYWPLPNVWLGTSVETQEYADERVPELLKIPAAVRFLSCEPLLGKILLDDGCNSWLSCKSDAPEYPDENEMEVECCESYAVGGSHFHGIDQVIVGGESGPNARPMSVEWARSLRDQCVAANVSYFFKQWGAWVPHGQSVARISTRGGDFHLWSDAPFAWSKKVGKKEAGRLLDGREWNELPRTWAAQEAT